MTMATTETEGKNSILGAIKARLGIGGGAKKYEQEVDRAGFEYSETLTTTALTGNGVTGARNRQLIYQKYQQMLADPLVSSAIRLHCTAALGGHETSGQLVFIEATAEAKKNPQALALVEKLAAELSPLFNRIAFQAAYNGAGYGDAYARVFTKRGVGVTGLILDEMLLPPLVIPYEQGDKTVICTVACGPRLREKMTMDQVARLKMPRMLYTPQPVAVEKAWRTVLLENDQDKLPLMPSLVGGSFLADAETQYNNFQAALQGLVGQRVLDAIDESVITVGMNDMTKEQQQLFKEAIVKMLKRSKAVADEAVKTGKPFLGRIRHLLPVWREKQVMTIQGVNASGGTGAGRAGNISIDDVMFHAKLLSGALGMDLSLLGFADIMSGGLGEGGFFRTSAQAAERSRLIRWALTDFFNHIIDVHTSARDGRIFPEAARPWSINFAGSIAALETERQKTQLDAVNTAQLMAATFEMVKQAGLDEAAMVLLFEKVMKMDSEDAKVYAASIAKARKEQEAREAQQAGFGGGGGGSPFGGADDETAGNEPPGAAKPTPIGKD